MSIIYLIRHVLFYRTKIREDELVLTIFQVKKEDEKITKIYNEKLWKVDNFTNFSYNNIYFLL